MQESLAKACHSVGFLVNELKECYEIANPVQEIIVRELTEKAVDLERRLKTLASAVDDAK